MGRSNHHIYVDKLLYRAVLHGPTRPPVHGQYQQICEDYYDLLPEPARVRIAAAQAAEFQTWAGTREWAYRFRDGFYSGGTVRTLPRRSFGTTVRVDTSQHMGLNDLDTMCAGLVF